MVCIYLSMYHLPHICHTLVPKIRVHPKMLCLFLYIDVLMHVYDLQLHVRQGQLEYKFTRCLP